MKLKAAACSCFVLASTAESYIAPPVVASGSNSLMRSRSQAPKSVLTERKMVGMIFDEEYLAASSAFPSMQPTPSSLSSSEIYVMIKLERWYSKYDVTFIDFEIRILIFSRHSRVFVTPYLFDKNIDRALSFKCPWMRRRALDFVDTMESVARVTLIGRNNLDVVGPPMGCRPDDKTAFKHWNLPIQDVAEIVRMDWRQDSSKGYYVTGNLTPSIYRDDCLFDGPDPDMPVKGLRKFRGAASQLFDRKKSNADLLDLWLEGDVIKAKWRMNGVIRLPWKPQMPEVTGETTYYLDEHNLVYKHTETWDISAMEAFFKTGWFSSSKELKVEDPSIKNDPESVPVS